MEDVPFQLGGPCVCVGGRQVLTGTQQGAGGLGNGGGVDGARGTDRATDQARGRLEFIGCTSLARVYKEKAQPSQQLGHRCDSLKTLSTALFIVYILTNFFFKQIQNNLKGENYT